MSDTRRTIRQHPFRVNVGAEWTHGDSLSSSSSFSFSTSSIPPSPHPSCWRNSQPSLQVASQPRPAEHVFSSPGRVNLPPVLHLRLHLPPFAKLQEEASSSPLKASPSLLAPRSISADCQLQISDSMVEMLHPSKAFATRRRGSESSGRFGQLDEAVSLFTTDSVEVSGLDSGSCAADRSRPPTARGAQYLFQSRHTGPVSGASKKERKKKLDRVEEAGRAVTTGSPPRRFLPVGRFNSG
ncbi:unnamed protein product [Pleuronectes platessa]|uniref:Uncharacterized protein n=1 Tax=Pleuronectes platessa TaxID=8262 RepID=A0A9N7TVP9_PLEPL|nr:unnamed protein product [Pleuronectes platessa]